MNILPGQISSFIRTPGRSHAASASRLASVFGTLRQSLRGPLGVGLALCALGTVPGRALTYEFTGADVTNPNAYLDANNWDLLMVPDLTTANTAQINNGAMVNYVAGPDLIIKNGGELEVTNGRFTQTNGPAYIQLNGGGTIQIDGGSFDQGTATSGPFNVTGTGNVFTLSAGSANFNRGFNVASGLAATISGGTLTTTGGGTTVNQSLTVSGGMAGLGNSLAVGTGGTTSFSGGTVTTSGSVTNNGTLTIANTTVNVGDRFINDTGSFSMSSGTLTTSGEFDFNNAQNTLSGGTIHTSLITGVNGGGSPHVFNISGGALTLSNSFAGGIYGGGTTQYINFTAHSTGSIEFYASTGDTVSTVQGFISNNVIEYNDTPYSAANGFSNFSITTDSMNDVFLTTAAVPEPATVLTGLMMVGAAVPLARRRLLAQAVL